MIFWRGGQALRHLGESMRKFWVWARRSIMDSTLNWLPRDTTEKKSMPKTRASSEVRLIRSSCSTTRTFRRARSRQCSRHLYPTASKIFLRGNNYAKHGRMIFFPDANRWFTGACCIALR